MRLPTFKYHPDPLSTGSIEPSDAVCVACGLARGFIYKGSVYAVEELADLICPWCIADGTAHEKFDAQFVDVDGVGGYGDWQIVPFETVNDVAFRTPGFSGWQQERWFTHCGDAGEFLGPAGIKELGNFGSEAISAIQRESGLSGVSRTTTWKLSIGTPGRQPTSSGVGIVERSAGILTAIE
jgi:uncharacterized protein CbrC (UPF0167 family)